MITESLAEEDAYTALRDRLQHQNGPPQARVVGELTTPLSSGLDRVVAMLDARLTAADMMRIFDLKQAAFYKWQAMGRFDAFEIRPRIGRRFWSAKRVRAYLDGDASAANPKPGRSSGKRGAQ